MKPCLTPYLKQSLLLLIFSLFISPIQGDEFPFKPPKDFPLLPGLGSFTHPVTTRRLEAQRYFNQGLTLIYAFNHDAAYWSFVRASQIDPGMAMAYWGIALAVGPNINMDVTSIREKVGYEAIQRALQLSSSATENERDYIRALATRYTNDPNENLKQLALNYKNAMKDLSMKYPDDLDAATLYVESGLDLNPWNQWTISGEPLEGTVELVETLESVLKRDPNHLGANHYYIHAIEASNHPERALMSAERLRHMVPASGHILHMPSHIYILVGDYHTAALCNEEAIKVDRAYIRQFGMRGIYPLHYMSHNLYFLSRAYSMEGRFADALKAAVDLSAFYAPHYSLMPDLEYYIPSPLFVFLRFHQWDAILNFPEPNPNMALTATLWHFARGIAFAGKGLVDRAQEEQQQFRQGKEKVAPDETYGYNKAPLIMAIADHLLSAKIADSQRQLPLAIEELEKAIALQDTLHYNEPPDWFFPVRESLGGALLRASRFEEAERVFRDDLDKHPRNGRSLFGLLQALKAQNRQADAFWIQREFNQAWKYSTTPLTVSEL